MPGTDTELLISDAAVKQIEKLKEGVEASVKAVVDLNKAGADLEAQIAKGNLGWAKTIGKMKQVTANGVLLEEAYKKLVSANDALQAAENKHHARLLKLAEAQRTQALLNEKIVITNSSGKNSTLKVVDAINAKQKADLKAQTTASEGIKVNTRAVLSEKALTVESQKETVEIGKLRLENKALAAERDAVDIKTAAGIAKVKILNDAIAENTKVIVANTATNVKSASTAEVVGKGLTKALGYLRTLAYILPGIGIAGIFNVLIESVTALFTGLSRATGAQKLLADVMSEAGKSSAFETWNLDRLYKKTQDTTLSITERKEAVDMLQKLYPAYFKNITDETILNGGAKSSYDELRTSIIAVAKAKAAEAAIQKVYADGMDKEILLINTLARASAAEARDRGKSLTLDQGGSAELGTGVLQYTAAEADAYRKTQKHIAQTNLFAFRSEQAEKLKILGQFLDNQEKLISDRTLPDKQKKPKATPRGPADMVDNSAAAYINAERARFMANYELMKKDSEKHAEINKKIADDDRKSLFERQDAIAAYYAYVQNLRDLEQTKELKEIELHNIALTNSIEQKKTKIARGKAGEYNNNTLKREIESEQFLIEENKKTIVTIQEKYLQERNDITEQFGAANQNIIQKYTAKEIKAAIERWKWVQAFNKQAAQEELDLIQTNLDAWAKMPDDTDRNPLPTEEDQYKFEKKMYYLNTYLDLEQTATTIIMGLADAQYNHEMALIDARDRKLNESYDEDKKRIMSSYTDKKDQEEEMLKLDARKEALQKQIERDRKAAARKRDKDQKASDIANIISSTAVAVTSALGAKPWSFANIAIAAGIAATGAANLSRVISTPLPAYKDGTQDHPGGGAVLGDGGKKELVVEPGKKPWVSAAIPTVYNLPKHTKVFSDAELAMPLYNAGLIHMANTNGSNTDAMAVSMLGAFNNKIDELITETKNNKATLEIIDLSSHRDHVRKNIR